MDQLSALIFLILTVCIGYAAASLKLLNENSGDSLVQLLFNICYPTMILETFATIDVDVLLGTGLPVLIVTVVITLVMYAIGLLVFRKLPGNEKTLLILMTTVGNVTYVVLPMFSIFLSAEAVMMAIIQGSAQDPIIWGLYHPMMLKSKNGKNNFIKEVLGNPCLLAAAAGIVLIACSIELPSFLLDTIFRISATTSPIALLLVGMLIKQYGPLSWLRDKAALIYSFLKVLGLPLIILAVLLPFLELKTAIILALLFASPGALVSVAWAKQYHTKIEFTIHSFIFSTMLYLVLITPLLILLAPYLT